MIETLNSKNQDDTVPLLDTDGDTIHVFLNKKNEATFLCNNCGNGVTRDLSKVLHVQTAIRVKCKCKCGHVFRVLVERRRNYRKSLNLLGMCQYLNSSGHTQKHLIKILDLSSTGLQFSFNGLHEFKVRDKVIVEFTLDDREKTEIRGKCTVKRIRSKSVGIEFTSIEHQRKLTFYLMR